MKVSTATLSEAPDDAQPRGEGRAWSQAARARVERQLAMLDRLAEHCETISAIAMRRAVALEERAMAGEEGDAGSEPAAADLDPKAFAATLNHLAQAQSRAMRSVRLTALLSSKLHTALEWLTRVETGRLREVAEEENRVFRAADHARKGAAQRIVTRIAEADHPDDQETVERLIDEACLELRDDDRFGDMLGRPLSDVIAMLCRDLGLSPDWPRLAEEAWARAEIAGGEVGAPLAAFKGPPDRSEPTHTKGGADLAEPFPPGWGKGSRIGGGGGSAGSGLAGQAPAPIPEPFPHPGGREAHHL